MKVQTPSQISGRETRCWSRWRQTGQRADITITSEISCLSQSRRRLEQSYKTKALTRSPIDEGLFLSCEFLGMQNKPNSASFDSGWIFSHYILSPLYFHHSVYILVSIYTMGRISNFPFPSFTLVLTSPRVVIPGRPSLGLNLLYPTMRRAILW